jgi:hypothetical protein
MMNEAESFFVAQSITHARTLPLSDCVKYLRGLLDAIGKNHPARRSLSTLYTALHISDAQMDLIEIGQLKLKLDTPAPRRKR